MLQTCRCAISAIEMTVEPIRVYQDLAPLYEAHAS